MAQGQWAPLPAQRDVVAKAPTVSCILSKVNWDSNYKHVRPFSSRDALVSYLQANSPTGIINSMTPVDDGVSSFRIPYHQMVAYGCNYIAFKGDDSSEIYRFAFIKRVTKLSNNSCKVEFELDKFQNPWYGSTLKSCFVVREHIAKSADIKGANTVPENIEFGEYTTFGGGATSYGDMDICIYASQYSTGNPPEGSIKNGIYTPALLSIRRDVASANSTIEDYVNEGTADAILSVFMAPRMCTDELSTDRQVNGNQAFGSYTPVNQKMFTYPFCYILVDDNYGGTAEFKYELFSGDNSSITFRSSGCLATAPAIYTVPLNYRGSPQDHSSAMVTTNFPICAWSTDQYQAWVAQNKSARALTSITAGIGGTVGLATGNVPLAVGSGVTIANQVAQVSDKQIVPQQAKGKVLSENIATALGLNRLDIYIVSCTAEMARRVDSYFSAYGYKVNQVKTPNWNTRSSWNYLETRDCGFTSTTANLDELREFRAIFDNGVTLWHTNDLGNYALANN